MVDVLESLPNRGGAMSKYRGGVQKYVIIGVDLLSPKSVLNEDHMGWSESRISL